MLRHQLPVYAPLSFGALAGALVDGTRGSAAVQELERVLAQRYEADAVRLCGSGTQALQLALAAARRLAGGEGLVALPAFACYDVASAAVGAGVPLLLYDLDPRTLAPDLDSLERACAAGARVIVAAHLYGVPLDWDALAACAARHGALLLEDAAQGHGAAWRDRRLGSLAPLSVLSFGRGKGWTGGAGGALLLREGASAGLLADLPPAGRGDRGDRGDRGGFVFATALAQWLLGRPAVYGIPASLPGLGLGETRYHEPRPIGPMLPIAAALALRTLPAADAHAALRRAAGGAWADLVVDLPGLERIPVPAHASAGYLRFPVRLRDGLQDRAAAARLGVAASYPRILADLPQLAALRHDRSGSTFDGARDLVRTLTTLPTHALVRPREKRAILRLLAETRG